MRLRPRSQRDRLSGFTPARPARSRQRHLTAHTLAAEPTPVGSLAESGDRTQVTRTPQAAPFSAAAPAEAPLASRVECDCSSDCDNAVVIAEGIERSQPIAAHYGSRDCERRE